MELIFIVRTIRKMHLKFKIDNLFNFDTGVILIFGYVTCPANFKRANYTLDWGTSPSDINDKREPSLSMIMTSQVTICFFAASAF